MTKKDLLKRIESLEDYLGAKYSETSDGYGEHITGEYGMMRKVQDELNKSK